MPLDDRKTGNGTASRGPLHGQAVAPGLFNAIKMAGTQWLAHKSAKAGASLAYYSVFSMGPLIVVVISLAALVLEREGVQHQVVDAIQGVIGAKGAEAVGAMLGAAGSTGQGLFATIIGTATLLFAAIGVIVQLKEALNAVWDVEARHYGGLWGFIREYLLSFAGVLALGFLLMISMLLSAGLAAIGKFVGSALPEPLMQGLSFAVSFLTTAAMFAMLFKWMPDAQVEWRDVILGAVGTAALFEIGKFAISFYIGPGIDIWGVGIDRRHSHLGLLLGPDSSVRRGVHPCAGPANGVAELGLARPKREQTQHLDDKIDLQRVGFFTIESPS